jgi:hypothetical protein
MSEQVETKQTVSVYKAIDKLVEDAYHNSGLRSFFLGGSVWLSDSVEFTRSNRSAPIWTCGPSVSLYGRLYMPTSKVLSIANSLGLFVDLMSDDLIEAVEYFVSRTHHDDFYNYYDSPDNGDNFYSEAFFDERPAILYLVSSSSFGTYKDGFLYLLVNDDRSCYSSYDEYYSDFFLGKMSDIVRDVVSKRFEAKDIISQLKDIGLDESESKIRHIMSYLETNRSKIIRWFELVDNEFWNAFEELGRRFDIFVKSFYRLEEVSGNPDS